MLLHIIFALVGGGSVYRLLIKVGVYSLKI